MPIIYFGMRMRLRPRATTLLRWLKPTAILELKPTAKLELKTTAIGVKDNSNIS